MNPVENNLGPVSAVRASVTDAQQRLLDVLSGFDGPATLAEIVTASGLHENTVRGHLDALRDGGHVTRLRSAPHGRGRPAWCWLARGPAYTGLVEALAQGLESGGRRSAQEVGRRGGRAWGSRLAAQLSADHDTAARRVSQVLKHAGFAPEEQPDGTIRLTRCPFLDAARAHPDSVCGVHRGLIEGAYGGAPGATSLIPFAEPGACLATVQ